MDCPTCCKRIGGEGSTWQRWGVLAECCGQPWCWTCRAQLFRSGLYREKVQPQCPACGKAMGEALSMYFMNICNSSWRYDWPAEKQADTDSKVLKYMASLVTSIGGCNSDNNNQIEAEEAAAPSWMECVNCDRRLKDERVYIVFEVEKDERALVPGHGHPLCAACFDTSGIVENSRLHDQQVELQMHRISHQLLRRRARMSAGADDDTGLHYFGARTVTPAIPFICQKCYPAGPSPQNSHTSFERVQIVSFLFSATSAFEKVSGCACTTSAQDRASCGDDLFSRCIMPFINNFARKFIQKLRRDLVEVTCITSTTEAALTTPLLSAE